jgi:hypothetical protein
MSIPVLCPHCLHTDRAALGMAGHRVRCPECDQPFLVVAMEQPESNPRPVPSLAFLDEQEDIGLSDERRLAPLPPHSVTAPPDTEIATTAEIPPAPQPAPTVSSRASPAAIYVGMGIGGIFAIFLGAAIFLFLRSDGGKSATRATSEADRSVVVGTGRR